MPESATAAAAPAEGSGAAPQELTALAWAPAGCPPTLLTATTQVLVVYVSLHTFSVWPCCATNMFL